MKVFVELSARLLAPVQGGRVHGAGWLLPMEVKPKGKDSQAAFLGLGWQMDRRSPPRF